MSRETKYSLSLDEIIQIHVWAKETRRRAFSDLVMHGFKGGEAANAVFVVPPQDELATTTLRQRGRQGEIRRNLYISWLTTSDCFSFDPPHLLTTYPPTLLPPLPPPPHHQPSYSDVVTCAGLDHRPRNGGDFFHCRAMGVVMAAGRAFRQGPLGSLRHQEGVGAS